MIGTDQVPPHSRQTVPRQVAIVLTLMVMTAPVDSTGIAADPPRVPWNTSRLVGSPDPPLPYRAVRTFEKLPLFQPVYVRAEPGTHRMILVDHQGSWAGPGGLRAFDDHPDVTSSVLLLELDRLIYGFCFHPKYRDNGYLYVISNGPVKDAKKYDRISRFTIDRRPPFAVVADSELVVLEWESNGHNGGDLAFGPDGFLYCPTGDGSSDSDTLVTGQGLNDLLAVMLRLDVDRPTAARPYAIPADNPFVNVPNARPEIWASGFRNPWRMNYDHRSNQLWVTQNGQDLWEQVYLVRKGENYGWSVTEGSHPFYPDRETGPQPIIPPTAEHHHSVARSLTGGIVYWGEQLPELQGAYIYGDFSTGRIWGVKHDGQRVTEHRELADTTLQIVGFAADQSGELLIVDHGGGLYRLAPTPPKSHSAPFPRQLSETGLFESTSEHRLVPGVIPYSVNVELWSDGAHKERWLAVPGDQQIEFKPNRGWNFPDGAVLVKSFALPREANRSDTRRWIETRLMVKQEGEWVGYSYRWNDQQTDATLVDAGGFEFDYQIHDPQVAGETRQQTWRYPSRAECLVCHSRAANFVLGLTSLQMNRDHDYESGRRNQLEMLDQIGMFSNKLPKRPAELARLTNPYDAAADLRSRALSYLHANCSNCHVSAGGGNAAFEMEFDSKPETARLYDATPVHSTFGMEGAKVIASGQPDKSLLLYRMSRRGHGQMPPLATNQVDERAIALIRQWIEQLESPSKQACPSVSAK